MQEFKLPEQITIAELRDSRLSLVKREIPPNQPENQSQSCQPSALHFPLKSAGTVYDLGIILARGLDQMIAALAIWEAKHPDSIAVNNHQSLDDALKNFFNKLVEINNTCNLNAEDKLLLAKKSLKTLTSECLTHLGMKNKDIQTFLTVRDIVYKEYFGSYSVRSDIYSQEPGSESTKLGTVVYQPISFFVSNIPEHINITEQYKSALKDPKKDTKKETNDTRNGWVEIFLNKKLENNKTRGDNLKTLSMTPMTRVAALPANAYKMTYQSEQNDTNYPSFYSMAFAVPFKIKDKSERDNSTKLNLQLMLTDQSVLLETAQAFRDRWQPDVQGIITLPLTYQTLVTRIALKKMPDYDKSPRGLEEIVSSLDSLKTDLAEKQYVLLKNEDGKEELVEYDSAIHANAVKYKFDLLTANTCINRYHKISAERERDYQTIKTLLDLTKEHIDRELNEKIKSHLDTVKSFLDKPDASYFTPYLSRGRAVKEALDKISQSNEQLGLLLSAAVELKVCSHETVFGSLRRQALDKIQPRWLQQMLRVLSFILASLIKIPVAPVLLSHWLKHHNSRRKMFYRAAYLNIVAAHLGRSVSSCMSSADRQKELESFISALMADFKKNKKLLGFNDPVKDKICFIKKYQLSANQIKRNIVRMATGSPSTQDNELLPFFKQFGSRAGLFVEHSQKELNKIVKSLRYAESALVVKLAGITMAQAFGADASNSSGKDTLSATFTCPQPDSLNFPEIEFVSQNKDSQPPIASNKIKWRWIITGGLLLGAAAGLMFGTGGLGLVAIPLGVLLKCLLVKLGLAVLATSSASVFVAAGAATLFAGLSIYRGMHTEESTQSLKV